MAGDLVFCGLNGRWVEAPDDLAYDLVIDVAKGRLPAEIVATQVELWLLRSTDESGSA